MTRKELKDILKKYEKASSKKLGDLDPPDVMCPACEDDVEDLDEDHAAEGVNWIEAQREKQKKLNDKQKTNNKAAAKVRKVVDKIVRGPWQKKMRITCKDSGDEMWVPMGHLPPSILKKYLDANQK